MNNKRGVRHVEAILSFIFFLGFGIATIYFFNPFTISQSEDNVLSKISNQIIDNTSIMVEKYTVVAAPGSGGGVGRGNLVYVNIRKPIGAGAVSRVTDINGLEIKSDVTDFQTGEIVVNLDNDIKTIMFVYLAEDFNPNSFPSGGRNPPQTGKERTYQISSLYSTEVISLKRLDALAKQYALDYDSLHQYFGVPKGKDFGFAVENIKTKKEISKGINVFAKKERMESMGLDNSILFKELEIKTW